MKELRNEKVLVDDLAVPFPISKRFNIQPTKCVPLVFQSNRFPNGYTVTMVFILLPSVSRLAMGASVCAPADLSQFSASKAISMALGRARQHAIQILTGRPPAGPSLTDWVEMPCNPKVIDMEALKKVAFTYAEHAANKAQGKILERLVSYLNKSLRNSIYQLRIEMNTKA